MADRGFSAALLPSSTSASQLQAWAMCPRRYFLQYVAGALPEHRSTALILGSAVHSTIEWWFQEQVAGREPKIENALEVISADLAAEAAGENVRWRDATPDSLEAQGRSLLLLYLKEHGTLPVAAVESKFTVDLADHETGEVLQRRMTGYFDLVLHDTTVVEVKTSGRSWKGQDLDRHLQLGAYVHAWNDLHGGPSKLQVHVLVKTKAPRIETYAVERGEPANRWWFLAAASIERAIHAGSFPPAPGPLCHECEHARACIGMTEEPVVTTARRPPRRHEPADVLAMGM